MPLFRAYFHKETVPSIIVQPVLSRNFRLLPSQKRGTRVCINFLQHWGKKDPSRPSPPVETVISDRASGEKQGSGRD